MPNKKYFHLFCADCKRGWHFKSLADILLIEAVHIDHVRYGSSVPIICGDECANDWEMCKNADV